MSLEALRAELAEGRIRPAYLLAGAEPLLRDDALAAIRAAVLAGAPADFNFDRLEGDATGPGALHDALRALPVMAQRRLVWLREPETGRGARGLLDALAQEVPGLADGGGCVLVVSAARVDRRERWVRAFAAPALVVSCDPPRDARAVAAFLREEARRQELALEAGVAELLAERIGPQLLMLRQELAKAALLAAPAQRVTRAHVEASAIDVAEQPIWDLTDAIGEGRTGEALALLVRMLRGGAPHPVVLASLAAHFRKLLRLRARGSVAGPPFVVKKLEAQSRRYTGPRLLAHLRAIHQADLALKGEGGIPPDVALERLVLALAA